MIQQRIDRAVIWRTVVASVIFLVGLTDFLGGRPQDSLASAAAVMYLLARILLLVTWDQQLASGTEHPPLWAGEAMSSPGRTLVKSGLRLLCSLAPGLAAYLLVALPWLNGWGTGPSLLWSAGACGIGVLLVGLLRRFLGVPVPLLHDPWPVADFQEWLAPGEEPQLVFPVRRRVGGLPYVLLEPGFVLVLTERRVLAFGCRRFTHRIARPLWPEAELRLSVDEGRWELSAGDGGGRTPVATSSAYRADVEFRLRRRAAPGISS